MATFAVPQTLPSAREVELVRLLGSLCAAIRIEQLERERDDALAALDRLTAVLEVRRERPEIAPAPLASLTQREAEVAVLIAEGLADREIARRLYLSHHTVSQYVKRIYRKLDVDGRVGLTRLLLGAT